MLVRSFTSFCLIGFSLLTTVSGQWATQWHAYPEPRKVYQISIADPSHVWLLMADSLVPSQPSTQYSRTLNGGSTWIPGNLSLPSGWSVQMIKALNGNVAWACVQLPADTGGTIYHTTDGGQNWTPQPSAVFFTGPRIVHFWDADTGLCIGNPHADHFEVFTTYDGGNQWDSIAAIEMPVAGDDLKTYASSYCVQGDTLWFGGYTTGRIFVTHDKGAHWSSIAFPEFNVPKVMFRDTMGLAGYTDPVNNDNRLYLTEDGGLHWQLVASDNLTGCYDLCFVPGTAGTLVAAGEHLMVSNDWSENWAVMEDPATPSPVYSTVSFIDLTTGWAGGTNYLSPSAGGIYKYNGSALTAPDFQAETPELNIYPNPGNTTTYFSWNQPFKGKFTIDLLSPEGRKVAELISSENDGVKTFSTDLSRFAPGIYLVKLTHSQGTLIKKLVIN